jgi:hypothetical protein
VEPKEPQERKRRTPAAAAAAAEFELRGEDEHGVKRESIYGQSRTRKTKMAIKLVLNFFLKFPFKEKKNVQKENERKKQTNKTPTDCY